MRFMANTQGVVSLNKHIAWYTSGIANSNAFRQAMYEEDTTVDSLTWSRGFKDRGIWLKHPL